MSALAEWHKRNEDHLAAALQWLRLMLARHAERSRGPVVVTQEETAPPAGTPDEELASAERTMRDLEQGETPPALVIIAQRFGLSRFEQSVLLLCAAAELDPAANRPQPTFAQALWVFENEASWDALSPERPLRYWRLIEISQPAGQPLTASALRADERIVNFIKGLNYLDDRLTPMLIPFDGEHPELSASQQTVADTIVQTLRAAPAGRVPLINLDGPDPDGKQGVARQAAAALDLLLYRLPAHVLPQQPAELETLARLWQRESVLLPLALYLDAHSAHPEHDDSPLHGFIARTSGPVFLDTRDVWAGRARTPVTFDVAKPSRAEQQELWTSLLGEAASDDAARLASQFDLNLSAIRRVATTSQSIRKVWTSCLATTRPRLEHLAQRLDVKATLREVVLPPAEKELLKQIARQVGQRGRVYEQWGFARKMNRGLGISALFAGDSGTGKTMAAEGIAKALCLDLYRIDLSSVMSKFIGETPKNLRQLFDAAEDGGAILFFDEADALFGKRSEVKDSHDRYANVEIDYLLQRIEAYRGLAILATNMKSALDPAFLRRLRFIVNFPYPGPPQRREIWRRVFPRETKTAGLDYDRLARLDLTGGSIHNVALNAAFLAARTKEQVVTMPLILDAARTEFRKMDKFVSEAELRWEEKIA